MRTVVGILLLPFASAIAYSSNVTPVQKVVQLMNELLEKGKKEKHEEEVQFAAYSQWCEGTIAEKKEAIQEADDRIAVLSANIDKYGVEAKRLGKEVAELDAQVQRWKDDIADRKKAREEEKDTYTKTEAEYSESISALSRAVDVLSKQNHDRKQAAAMLLQVRKLVALAPAQRSAIESFLHLDQEPEVNAYEFQSGGVIEMLQKLLDKFEEEHDQLIKAETNAQHAHGMYVQDLTGQVEDAKRQSLEKSESKASYEQQRADAQAEKKQTQAARDADKKYLDDTTATCAQKASDFKDRSKLRSEEIEAVEQAIEIISSADVSGAADKHFGAVAKSFLQLRSSHQFPIEAKNRAVAFLKEKADAMKSDVLSVLAVRAASAEKSGADPFRKVREMIQDLITKLLEEANQEAEKKGWCDEEIARNTKTRDEKTKGVEDLQSERDLLNAHIAELSEQISENQKQITKLTEDIAENTELRKKEKATNAQTVADAKAAQEAVARALTILEAFYTKAGVATAFAQQPEIFDRPYQGMGGESKGVIGLLKVIQTDFARLESETENAEAQAQKEFDEFLEDASVNKGALESDTEHKTNTRSKKNARLQVALEDLEKTQEALNKALNYWQSLKAECIDAGVNYDDRVRRRQEEMESLQEALRILNGADLS